jgi:hypothetical protein
MKKQGAETPTASQVFLLVGVLFVAPVIIGYSVFSYWVFQGKTPKEGWGRMNERRRRILWFAALYVAGLVTFLLVTTAIKASLKLLR